jgi:hypothetical protein
MDLLHEACQKYSPTSEEAQLSNSGKGPALRIEGKYDRKK